MSETEMREVAEDEAAYGLLWRMHTTDKAIHECRRLLRDKIGREGQVKGITWANTMFGPNPIPALEDMP